VFRVSDLLDLPIKLILQDHVIKFTAKSLLIDGLNNKVSAIICKEGTMKKTFRLIPYSSVISIDLNGIIIAKSSSIKKVHSKELNNFIQLDCIMNKLVKSSDGDLKGILTDIYINLLNGKIVGYELSEGYIDDILNGRKVINFETALKNNISSDGLTIYQRLN
jgi:uncharacterized protein YrrD